MNFSLKDFALRNDETQQGWKEKVLDALRSGFRWGEQRIPWGLRSVAGIILFIAGFFGFLPILGFWMAPLGLILIALDIPPLKRWLGRKLGVKPGEDYGKAGGD